EVRRREPEEQDHHGQADDDRQRAEVAGAQVQPGAGPEAGNAARELLLLVRGCCAGPDDVDCAHASTPAVEGMPATLVGLPAVIASTTSCCVVERRSKTPTFRPSRSTAIRSAVSKTSWRLCE